MFCAAPFPISAIFLLISSSKSEPLVPWGKERLSCGEESL